jgi:hypothetical protein
MDQREKRRIAGMLQARLPDLGLEKVEDRRRSRGKRWPLATILRTVIVGLCAGCKSLAELEALTEDMELPMRRLLKIPRRIPDTTMRDALVRQHPYELRESLKRLMKAALRRGSLPPSGLPFHVAALDGKGSATPSWDHHYGQQQTYDDGRTSHGILRTVSVALVSTEAKPVLDAVPIPAETNEMGIFPVVFEALVRKFGNAVRLVTYDAGVTGAENCQLVVEAGKDYLFRIKNERWLVTQEAQRLLGTLPKAEAAAHTEDVISKGERRGARSRSVHRYVFLRQVQSTPGYWTELPGLKTLVRVLAETEEDGRVIASEDRYFVSSLAVDQLEGWQWLGLVRNHWAVENNCHWTFDAIFREDEHLWIEEDARGAVVMTLLRRIAYTLLALYRSVTLRSAEKRQTPWRRLLSWVHATVVGASDLQLSGLRERTVVADV